MALNINLSDKILAGVNQSYTITSGEGSPAGKVLLDGVEIEHRVIPLGPDKTSSGESPPPYKYKVSFFLPDDSAGKELELKFSAGSSTAEEKVAVTAE